MVKMEVAGRGGGGGGGGGGGPMQLQVLPCKYRDMISM